MRIKIKQLGCVETGYPRYNNADQCDEKVPDIGNLFKLEFQSDSKEKYNCAQLSQTRHEIRVRYQMQK